MLLHGKPFTSLSCQTSPPTTVFSTTQSVFWRKTCWRNEAAARVGSQVNNELEMPFYSVQGLHYCIFKEKRHMRQMCFEKHSTGGCCVLYAARVGHILEQLAVRKICACMNASQKPLTGITVVLDLRIPIYCLHIYCCL